MKTFHQRHSLRSRLGLSKVAKDEDGNLDIEAVPLTVGGHELLQRGRSLYLELGRVPTGILHLTIILYTSQRQTQVYNAQYQSIIGSPWT